MLENLKRKLRAMESEMPQTSDWLKPAAFFGYFNLLVLLFVAFNTYNQSEAATGTRLTKIETTIDVRILPTLKRIEDKIEK